MIAERIFPNKIFIPLYMHVFMYICIKDKHNARKTRSKKSLAAVEGRCFPWLSVKEHAAITNAVKGCLQTRNICTSSRLQPWQTCRYMGKNTRLNISTLNTLNPTSKSIFEQRSCCLEWYTHRQRGSRKHRHFRSGIKSKAKGQIPKRQRSVSHFSS